MEGKAGELCEKYQLFFVSGHTLLIMTTLFLKNNCNNSCNE